MPKGLTWRKAIDKVLAASSTPLHYNEITERILADGLLQNVGVTPSATVAEQTTWIGSLAIGRWQTNRWLRR